MLARQLLQGLLLIFRQFNGAFRGQGAGQDVTALLDSPFRKSLTRRA